MARNTVGRLTNVAKGTLLLFLWGSLTVAVQAQTRGKIAGTAYDAETGETLPGVNIVVVGTPFGTATDIDGDYFIANLSPGTYDVRATYIGYRDVLVEDVNVDPDRTTEIDFRMEPSTLELGEDIVVTATRPLVEQDNTTSSVRLESSEVSTLPTSSFTNVLTTLPGVDLEGGEMYVRGGGLDQVAFVVDGARARNPIGFSPYTRVNLSSIAEVEVITGSFNAEYGEAQSGVINVITKEGSPQYEFSLDSRYIPAGKKHWGTSFYDQSSELYWENTHARHLEWWVEYPDQWVDPNGIPGSDPRSVWTPEEAYQNYLATHQPLTNYTEIPTYEVEAALGGPVPLLNNLFFYGTLKRRSEAPIFGNAFRDRGLFTDGTLKLTYQFRNGMKLTGSGFYGQEETGWGFGQPDYFWAQNYGVEGRYAYYDFPGYPYSQIDGQTLTLAHALNASTLYEVQFSRVHAVEQVDVFPGDSLGFDASDATRDLVRAVYPDGEPIPGAYAARIGYHTTGYYFRYDGQNVEYRGEGYISSQLNKFIQVKSGFEHSQYMLDHYNAAKLPTRRDSAVYNPFQGAVFGQSKIELGGLIINAGLRFDYYAPNDTVYTNLFDPLQGEKRKTRLYSQLSPRIGISHPIDTRTVLHFSYGHFFQRPPFNDYGEQGGEGIQGNLNTFIVPGARLPWVLGNRFLEPRKTIAFEVGLERNFWDFFVFDVTAYYKDSRNTIRTVTIQTPFGTYFTNGNGDYGDNRGVELSIRKVPSTYSWGSTWGYANFTTRQGIFGRSGSPSVVSPDGVRLPPTGDFVEHYNPIFKAGLFYETPGTWTGLAGSIFKNLSVALDYRANFPNEQIRNDFFFFEGEKHLRPVDQNTDLRARKEISLMNDRVQISPYLEVHNLFNNRWIFLGAFERVSNEDKRQFVESGFDYLPNVDANGVPILEVGMFRNLPRSVLFGVTVRL